MPHNLRPVNVARINVGEARISSPIRNDISSPQSVPMYLVPTTSEIKIVGVNPSSVMVQAPSVPIGGGDRIPLPMATQSVSTQSPSSAAWPCNFNNQVTDDGGEDSMSGKKVKLLCSFSGKILPRPSDGMLRYVGGQTRIITVRRDVGFTELVQKMVDACGQLVVMKYQLPYEDLDALVSVSCSDDLENMMEEYDKLLERSPDGSVKVRIFLLTALELDSSGMLHFGDLQDTNQKYVDAVNEGVMEVVGVGIAMKESISSATSTQNSDISNVDANDQSLLLGQDIPSPNSPSTRSDSTDIAIKSGCLDVGFANLSQYDNLLERTMPQKKVIKATTTPTPYLQGLMDAPQDTLSAKEYQNFPSHLIYPNPTQVVTTPRPLLLHPQHRVPATHMTMAPQSPNMSVNPTMMSQLMQKSQGMVTVHDQGYNNAYKSQVSGGVVGYVPQSMPYQQIAIPTNSLQKDNCSMCQKQLPHAHSDTMAQEQGFVAAVPDVNTIYQSLQLEDVARLHPLNKVIAPQSEFNGSSKDQIEGQCVTKHVKCETTPGAPLITTEDMSRESGKDQPRKDDIIDRYSQPIMITEADEVHAMVSPNDLEIVFANTIQSSMAQESASSLFSSEDPWSFLQDSPLPPIPSKIVTRKELYVPMDPLHDNSSSNDVKLMQEQLMDPIICSNSEKVMCSKVSSDLTKIEIQAQTEEGMASMLQLPLSSTDISVPDANCERDIQFNIDAILQAKLEGINVKLEKANLAFPRSDGLGRLQIIKNIDLEELRELGSGTFGIVYHGKWRGTDVAIKRINNRCFAGKPSEQERMIDDFWNEAVKLAALHHPNVVAFYGVVLDGPGGSVATVTEYMVNGSLRTALQKNERTLDKRKRLLIAMDVAFGMEYLHSRNIVHFDLKSDNLLVNLRDTHRPICKVGDLGLSKVKCQTLISGGVRGTLPWMAPELLNGSSSLVSEKVDVFSFGIVMWELLTGEEPYGDLHYGAIIGGIVSNTLRPVVPDCDPDWRVLMEKCWSTEPSERPSFTEITDELRLMAAKIPSKPQTSSSPKTNVAHII